MKNFFITIGFSLIFLIGCLKKDDLGFFIFQIKKGNHRSTNRWKRVSSNTINFTIILTESCKYQSQNPENQYDINKVFGMSDGGSHMKNSARIGWRYVDNKLELHAFTHNNGKFDFKKICDVSPDSEYNCQITFLENEYRFDVSGNSITMPRYKDYSSGRYLLYPYFGGDETAPHDILIKIKYF